MRRARLEDASAVSSILSESFAEYMFQYTWAGMLATTPSADKVVTRIREGPVWLATVKGRMVGTISVVPQDDGLYVRGMAVLPEARGQAVGSTRLAAV